MKASLSILLALCMAPVFAQTAPSFKFTGFGTLALSHSSTDQADARSNQLQDKGPGASHGAYAGMDSKLGVQLNARIDPSFSGTLQVLAQHDHEHDVAATLEWANLKYRFGEGSYIRGGRIAAPIYMISEYRNVGYAQTPVRPPNDVYSSVSISSIDGVDVGGSREIGSVMLSWQGAYGYFKRTIWGGQPVAIDARGGLANARFEYGNSGVRLSYIDARVSASTPTGYFEDYRQALAILSALGYPGAAEVHAETGMDRVPTRFLGIGIDHDNGRLLLQGELTFRRSDSVVVPDLRSWYTLGAYRLGAFTPYLGYSEIRSFNAGQVPLLNPVPAPPELQPAVIGINYMSSYFMQPNDQRTLSLGLRYDFAKNWALKLQLDRISKPAGSAGLFIRPEPGFNEGRQTVHLGTLAVDFLF